MKRTVVFLVLFALILVISCSMNSNPTAPEGPAPNAGDGVSDGSGMDGPSNDGPGPAPNAGDGVSDGSGF